MADVQVEVGGSAVKVEKLGIEALYSASLRALKVVEERDVQVVKDFDYENSRVAPLVHVACKCSYVDFESGKPVQAFVAVLNELAMKGIIKSFFQEPSRVPASMDPNKAMAPADGYVLFAMVHVLPEDLLQVKSKYPFLINEGEPLPPWSLEVGRIAEKSKVK